MNSKEVFLSLLAGCMMSYIVASLWYMYQTKSIPADFNDSLSSDQKDILCESSKTRKKHFMNGLILGLVVTLVIFWLMGESEEGNSDNNAIDIDRPIVGNSMSRRINDDFTASPLRDNMKMGRSGQKNYFTDDSM